MFTSANSHRKPTAFKDIIESVLWIKPERGIFRGVYEPRPPDRQTDTIPWMNPGLLIARLTPYTGLLIA
ncbi:hypothetical protein DPMN_036681 [Dreissena polymorpha]|uniref:Uncharacterized protein n=1 Tax=Dreissena polymorpha TaxID=45954 RepID=A0A9D4MDZ8_DREPO|nr:hypothetical protein DPMN_036681 [Dreissena polymorpha]